MNGFISYDWHLHVPSPLAILVISIPLTAEDDADKDEDEERMKADDLSEGLGQQRRGKKAKAGKKTAAAQDGKGNAPGADEAIGRQLEGAPLSMQQRLVKAKLVGISEGQVKESARALAYIPSPKFTGARPGYMFKRGGLGLGYYHDQPPDGRSKNGGRDKVAGKASGKGSTVALDRSKAPIIPAGGSKRGGAWSDSDDDLEPPPVVERTSKSVLGQKGRQDRRKALPGRLRKKLAKDSGRA